MVLSASHLQILLIKVDRSTSFFETEDGEKAHQSVCFKAEYHDFVRSLLLRTLVNHEPTLDPRQAYPDAARNHTKDISCHVCFCVLEESCQKCAQVDL